jgi:transcription initiation factor IIE alpha subunit
MVFVERYEQENAVLKEQNMKLINSTLELTQNNNVLKEKLQQLDDERKQLTERLHRASSTS